MKAGSPVQYGVVLTSCSRTHSNSENETPFLDSTSTVPSPPVFLKITLQYEYTRLC